LVLKSTFPDQASNNEWARYYYYLGRIKALQLDYTEAHKHLLQSARKAPRTLPPDSSSMWPSSQSPWTFFLGTSLSVKPLLLQR